MSTLASTSTARAIATSCWTAIGCWSSTERGSMSSPRRSRVSAGPAVHLPDVDRAEAARLAAEQHVLRDREVGDQVDLLVDRADAGGLRGGRRGELVLLAADEDRAGVDAVDAREGLDQRRLAGAVLAHEGVDLAGEETQGDLAEGPHGAEGDGDVAHLDHGDRCRRRTGGPRPARAGWTSICVIFLPLCCSHLCSGRRGRPGCPGRAVGPVRTAPDEPRRASCAISTRGRAGLPSPAPA